MSIISDKDPCGWPMRRCLFLFLLSISGIPKFVNIKKIQKKLKNGPCQHKTGQKDNKKTKIKNTNTKIKCVWGGPIFSICSVWSLTQSHSWNSLPCSSHQEFSIIATYRPPATTISYSTSSSPEKKNPSSNRLGIPLAGGLRSQKGLRPFNPLQNH